MNVSIAVGDLGGSSVMKRRVSAVRASRKVTVSDWQ